MKAPEKAFNPVIIIHLIGLLFFASSFTINPLRITRAFFSDEAVYYTMALSFAHDGDMEFQRADLIRVYTELSAGPTGILLKLNGRDGNIVFGKAFLYSLLVVPFILLMKTNGFLAFHALLLWLNLLCAYRFCRSMMQPGMAALFAVFYFVANASLVYLFWMTPEYFNMSLICYAFFFFVAPERLKSERKIFSAPCSYWLAALFFALATYSKPTNALLIAPLGIWLLAQKKVFTSLATLGIYAVATVGLFASNVYLTGEWNYQGGQRAIFYDHYPFERPGVSEFAPFKKKREVQALVKPPFHKEAFLHNWFYFFSGRFSGLAIYFFPMFFCLLYFLLTRKTPLSVAVYIAGWMGILTYMIGLPWNYFGGSGTIGNRYLMSAFPVFLFAIGEEPSPKTLFAGFAVSLLFCSVFLFTPVFSSFDNAFHQKRNLFRILPVEKTLLADLPINSNPRSRRVTFDQPAGYLLYFMDDNTYFKESVDGEEGFWVKGGKTADFVLRAFDRIPKIRLRLKSIAANNLVTVEGDSRPATIALKEPAHYATEIELKKPLPYDRDNTGATYLYDLKIHSQSGAISTEGNLGERNLGVFIRIEVPGGETHEIPPEQSND